MYLRKEQEFVITIFRNFGGVSKEQMLYLFTHAFGLSDNASVTVINGLYAHHDLTITEDNMIVPYNLRDFNRKNILLLWCVINEIINMHMDKIDAVNQNKADKNTPDIKYDHELLIKSFNNVRAYNADYDLCFMANNDIYAMTFLTFGTVKKVKLIEKKEVEWSLQGENPTPQIFVFESGEYDNYILDCLEKINLRVPYDVYFIHMPDGIAGLPDIHLNNISIPRK